MELLKVSVILMLAIILLPVIYGYRKRELKRLRRSFDEWLKARND